MNLLGKLLILFNLLAAGGFLYLATQDWKGRQTITAASIPRKLQIVGLPLEGPDTFDREDETDFRVEMAGGFQTQTISKKILDTYFKLADSPPNATTAFPSDNGPVPCQLAEVKRVKAKIESYLKDKNPGEKVRALKEWLENQSETYDQRLEVKALVAAGNDLELEKRMTALFTAVLDPAAKPPADNLDKLTLTDQVLADLKNANVPDTVLLKLSPLKNKEMTREEMEKELDPLLGDLKAEEKAHYRALIVDSAVSYHVADVRSKLALDTQERQNRIARLLVHLSQDPAWQKRVMLVVGLRRYVNAIADQAVRYKNMYARLELLIVTEQKEFMARESDLNQIARARTDLANQQSKLKAEKAEELRKEDDFLGQRKTQLDAIKKQLAKTKAEVDEMLVNQGKIESGLFEVQREVAITLDEIYALEAELEKRERELLKLYPVPK
jgi:hypothetical protein